MTTRQSGATQGRHSIRWYQ